MHTEATNPNRESVIDFPGAARPHIGLAVTDLESSERFYRILFDAEPSKVRAGYVKFEPDSPSLNLTLNEVGKDHVHTPRPPSHFGIQVKSRKAVHAALQRFEEAGLRTLTEEETSCCYAVQDKVWVTDPDGNAWEIFVVTRAEAPRPEAPSACCGASEGESASCC